MTDAEESATSIGSTGDTDVWPDEALGAYYQEIGISPGIADMYFGFLANMELSRDGMVVTHLSCNGTATEERFEVQFDGSRARIEPLPGQARVLWFGVPVASELVFEVGDDCATLETQLVEPVDPDVSRWSWSRGAVFLFDECGPEDDVWGYDVSPDVPIECG